MDTENMDTENTSLKSSVFSPNIEKPICEYEAIGIRTLGEKDPRLMTEEEFNQSPDLLFHGFAYPLNFTPLYDYTSSEAPDFSKTLGFGLYTTDNRQLAEEYARLRARQLGLREGVGVVTPVLPYQARVLDLRRKENPQLNAPIPLEFFLKWKKYYINYLKKRPAPENKIQLIIQEMEDEYFSYLLRISEIQNLDLREMLGTAPLRANPKISLNYSAPPWVATFTQFMIELGYDGLVYNEGREIGFERPVSGPTYVFYNLTRIGPYEYWQKQSKND